MFKTLVWNFKDPLNLYSNTAANTLIQIPLQQPNFGNHFPVDFPLSALNSCSSPTLSPTTGRVGQLAHLPFVF
jgi:hypothetical protein